MDYQVVLSGAFNTMGSVFVGGERGLTTVFNRLCFLTSVDFFRLSGVRHTGSAGLDHSCVNQWRYSIASTAATSCHHMHSDLQGTLLVLVTLGLGFEYLQYCCLSFTVQQSHLYK